MTNPPTHDPIRECALKLLDRATISLAAYGTRQSKELVVEINILLAEAKCTSAEKQQPIIDLLSEHEGLGPYMKVVAAPASAEGRTLEERLADLELRLGAINRLWQRYGNRLDALEERLAGDGRSVLSTLPIYADWKRDAQYVAEVLDWLLAQMRTLRGEA